MVGGGGRRLGGGGGGGIRGGVHGERRGWKRGEIIIIWAGLNVSLTTISILL